MSTPAATSSTSSSSGSGGVRAFKDREKPADVRLSNILAAKGSVPFFFYMYLFSFSPYLCTTAAVADAARTSLGPKGMDKMVMTFAESVFAGCGGRGWSTRFLSEYAIQRWI